MYQAIHVHVTWRLPFLVPVTFMGVLKCCRYKKTLTHVATLKSPNVYYSISLLIVDMLCHVVYISLQSLKKPVVPLIVGTDNEWESTVVGLLVAGQDNPPIDLQNVNTDAELQQKVQEIQ